MAATTEHRGYGLPNAGEPLSVDAEKLSENLATFQASLIAIDVDVHKLFTALDGKANTDHKHAIGDVNGLETALAGKAAANHAHKLDDLTDVSGADDAPTTGTHALVKTPAGYVPKEVAAILGAHSHTAADITDLATVLSAYAKTTVLSAYALLASPALTGNPTAPTQARGNNSTRLATTAFVQAALPVITTSTANPSGGVDGQIWLKVQ